MSSHTGHVTAETVYGQTLALQLGNGDEHRTLESDTTGLNVKGNLYLTYILSNPMFSPLAFLIRIMALLCEPVFMHCPFYSLCCSVLCVQLSDWCYFPDICTYL